MRVRRGHRRARRGHAVARRSDGSAAPTNATRSAIAAASSARPSSAEAPAGRRARRSARHGADAVGAQARQQRRQRLDVARLALRADELRREREHQRGLGAAGVGVAAPARVTRRDVAALVAQPRAPPRASGSALPPCAQTNSTRPRTTASGRARRARSSSASLADRQRARRSRRARRSSRTAAPGRPHRRRDASAARSARRDHRVGVSGRCGPCCSVAPSGTTSRSPRQPRGDVSSVKRRGAGRSHPGSGGRLASRSCDRGVAEAEQRGVDAAAQDVEHVLDARLAVGGEAPQVGAADHHRPGAERERLDDVAAAADAAVEQRPRSGRRPPRRPRAARGSTPACRRGCCRRGWRPRSRSRRRVDARAGRRRRA